MRIQGLVAAVALAVGLPGLATAGLYHPAEPVAPVNENSLSRFLQLDYPALRSLLIERVNATPEQLLQVADDDPRLREDRNLLYRVRAARLRARERSLGWTVEDRVNLSAYLIRLHRLENFHQAITVLSPVANERDGNFMVWSNLATAYQLAGQADRAVLSLQQALRAWPRVWPGWTRAELDGYHRAETYHLKLLQLRQRTSLPGRGPSGLRLDALFLEPQQWVGESKDYEPGELAAAPRRALPGNAVQVVQQLLTWLPHDDALYWQLGELLNAQGDVSTAYKILDQLVYGRRLESRDLNRHRQVLKEAQEIAQAFTPLFVTERELTLWAVQPRQGSADVFQEGSVLAAHLELKRRREQADALELSTPLTASAPPQPEAEAPPRTEWLPEPRQLFLVGGMAAVVIGLFAYFQIRETYRRLNRSRRPARG